MADDKIKAKARNNAYVLLRSRPRSEYEIRQRLKQKGYEGDVIDGVVTDLERTGNIEDAKFAHFWIESRMNMNPMGDVILRHELKLKGVSEDVIEAALEDKAKNYDEYEAVFNMASERYKRFQKMDPKKALKRVYDFLLRRGFKYDTVKKIIEEIGR